MEVSSGNSDVELDTLLLQQFSCMATQDKDVLISQFENLFGNSKPGRDVCAFYLEMNNWNLSAAVGSYFEFQQESGSSLFSPLVLPAVCCPSAKVETSSEVSSIIKVVPPNSKFHHSWKVRNTGSELWPTGCTLRFVDGVQMSLFDRVTVHRAPPFELVQVDLHLTSPSEVGSYETVWQLSTMTGTLFGEPLSLCVQVTTDSSLLAAYSSSAEMMSDECTTSHCDNSNIQPNAVSSHFVQDDSESMELS